MKNKIKTMSVIMIVVTLLLSNVGIALGQQYNGGEYVDYYGANNTYPIYIEKTNVHNIQKQISVPLNLIVPVRFKYQVHGNELEAGDGVPLEIVENVYVGNDLVFRQGSGGIAKVSNIKRAGLLGRSGTIEINSGEITDMYGGRHLISFMYSSKGSGKLGPLVLTLLSSGLAIAVVPDLLFNNLESTLFGTGLALAPIHFVTKKGKEAKVSDGKVMYARIVSSN